MQRHDLIDTDGENKAIRSFLRFYLKPGISIGEMRDNMEGSGWEGCWPESIGAADWNSTLTKFEVQAWLRHLFSLEAQFAAPAVEHLEVRADAFPDYARDPTGVTPIPVRLPCPECGVVHVDEGVWAVRLHKTHQCQACKHEWRPYEYPTVGVTEQVDTDRIEAICRAFEDGVRHGIVRDGENSEHEDPAQATAYILGYNAAANKGACIGALVEDRYLLSWLADNFCAGALDDFDRLSIKNSLKWEFLAPKGVQGDLREVLRAALERDIGGRAGCNGLRRGA